MGPLPEWCAKDSWPDAPDLGHLGVTQHRESSSDALLRFGILCYRSISSPTGQWSEPRSSGQMKASCMRLIAAGDART